MCFKCDLRARAQAGDDDARMTLEALDNQQLNLVWPLIVGELMEKAGLTTFTVDVHCRSTRPPTAGSWCRAERASLHCNAGHTRPARRRQGQGHARHGAKRRAGDQLMPDYL
jgi:hypothetical protein